MSDRISRDEFLNIWKDPEYKNAPTPGKAEWNKIYAELKKTNLPLDIKTIWEEYVHEVVTRFRTKEVLKEWALKGKCKKVFWKGRYWFYFGEEPIPSDDEEEEK